MNNDTRHPRILVTRSKLINSCGIALFNFSEMPLRGITVDPHGDEIVRLASQRQSLSQVMNLVLVLFFSLLLHSLCQTSPCWEIRKPQALHSVRAPSGPRRHSGVCWILQLWQCPGGAARFYIRASPLDVHFSFYILSFLTLIATNTCLLGMLDRIAWLILEIGDMVHWNSLLTLPRHHASCSRLRVLRHLVAGKELLRCRRINRVGASRFLPDVQYGHWEFRWMAIQTDRILVPCLASKSPCAGTRNGRCVVSVLESVC
jgi:hypothetical protein